MNYSIGEVSDLLHLSRDMIRYYEKQGTIHSKRNSANNYRYYDEMDIFWLLEAMQHKSWGINISDISKVRMNQYAEQTSSRLEKISESLDREIRYKVLLSKRLKGLCEKMKLSFANIGNYWIAEIPAYYAVHLVDGTGDQYQRMNLSEDAGKQLFSDRVVPFTDSGFTAFDEKQSWELRICEEYARELKLDITEDFMFCPKRICLCTNADIGEIGSFDLHAVEDLKRYASSKKYHIKENIPIRGLLVGRGVEDHSFHRIVELQMEVCL